MIIKTNYNNKNNSIYQCDMCGRRFNGKDIKKISENNKKLYDLCTRCRIVLRKFVIKYRERRNESEWEKNKTV